MQTKVALVTGGGTGIGKAIAQKLISAGNLVVITGRREAVLRKTVKDLGENASFLQGDVSQKGIPKEWVQQIIKQYNRLDIVVNNAGVGSIGKIIDVLDEEIDSVFKTNVFAPLALAREAIPELVKTKGTLINISSVLSKGVMSGISVYSATKAAIDHVTRVLAAEYGAQGVRVNAIAPGFTTTEMTQDGDQEFMDMWTNITPMGRVGTPDEVASVVSFLASEEARWVTGQIIQASGGLMM